MSGVEPGREAVSVPYTGAMRRVDTALNPEIGALDEMLRRTSRMSDPTEIMAAFGSEYSRKYPYDLMVTVSRRGLGAGEYKVTRVMTPEMIAGTEASDFPNPWRDWALLELRCGGLVGELIGRGEPQVVHELDVRDDPVLGDALTGLGSCLAIPAYDGGEPLNWLLRFRRDPHGYTLDDMERELLTTNLFGSATRNIVTSHQFEEVNRELRRQFDEVARVQRSLLPHGMPEIPGVSLATSYLTSDQAGGDYYDFYRFGDDRWGLLVADVSGHGAAAATVMAMLQSIVASHSTLVPSDPRGMIVHLNTRLCDTLTNGMFVTGFFMVYDPRTGYVSYARCGHNPPRLLRSDGTTVEPLDGGDALPLGIDPDLRLGEGVAQIEDGDTLTMYTDGVTEAFSPAREMFGVERLDSAVGGTDGEPDAVVASVHDALYAFTGSRTRDDDQTLVVMRRNP